jgi:hypothetical protein
MYGLASLVVTTSYTLDGVVVVVVFLLVPISINTKLGGLYWKLGKIVR